MKKCTCQDPINLGMSKQDKIKVISNIIVGNIKNGYEQNTILDANATVDLINKITLGDKFSPILKKEIDDIFATEWN